MKKTIIASKTYKNLGLHKIISTVDFNKLTIERKIYCNGKICKEEITYYESKSLLKISWNNEIKYNLTYDYTITEV